MGRASRKGAEPCQGKSDDAAEMGTLFSSMKIAQAVQQADTKTMESMLGQCLPLKTESTTASTTSPHATIQDVKIRKSVGESFTGGRSTPIYHISCRIQREGKPIRLREFVVKLVLMPDNDAHTKMRRESYAVERRFYDCVGDTIRAASLTIPKLLASDLDGSKPYPFFCILMNDVSVRFPEHPLFLSVLQATCAMQWLARFHALFWRDASNVRWRRDLWDRGAFWTKKLETHGIAATWTATVRFLELKYPKCISRQTKDIGKLIAKLAPAIAEVLAEHSKTVGTLIHGDYKAANLFFAKNPDGPDSVAAVDFQFSGAGICAEDLAYLLYPDARGEFFESETPLLEAYHEELVSQLILRQKGGPSSMKYSLFKKYYELARIDMTRHWLSRGWTASTEGEAKLVCALEDAIVRIDDMGGDSSQDKVLRYLQGD